MFCCFELVLLYVMFFLGLGKIGVLTYFCMFRLN